MKLEPKIKLAKQYDEYANSKPQIQPQEPEAEQTVYIPKQTKQKPKKLFIKQLKRKKRKRKQLI